ncbi:MAG: hypothetical protein U9Q81_23220 [Pseudomonadota bacterium]|nr:hypothetical protein [Pseudomonadota bacterium]
MRKATLVKLLSLFGLVAALALSSATLVAGDPKPDGTIELKQWKVGFIVGVGGGEGTLKFKGKEYPLKIAGLRVGATAQISTIDLVGNVYNLTKVEDIEGTYTQLQASAALGGGAGVVEMENQNKVKLKLEGTQAGVDISLDLGGMKISLKK